MEGTSRRGRPYWQEWLDDIKEWYWMYSWHHSLMSSSHSCQYGLPLLDVPSIMPNVSRKAQDRDLWRRTVIYAVNTNGQESIEWWMDGWMDGWTRVYRVELFTCLYSGHYSGWWRDVRQHVTTRASESLHLVHTWADIETSVKSLLGWNQYTQYLTFIRYAFQEARLHHIVCVKHKAVWSDHVMENCVQQVALVYVYIYMIVWTVKHATMPI